MCVPMSVTPRAKIGELGPDWRVMGWERRGHAGVCLHATTFSVRGVCPEDRVLLSYKKIEWEVSPGEYIKETFLESMGKDYLAP